MTALDDANDLDALVEIVDALCETLSNDQTIDKDQRRTLASIAARATALYQKRVDDDPDRQRTPA